MWKALVGAFNQEKALVGAFSVIVQPVVEPMDRFTPLLKVLLSPAATWQHSFILIWSHFEKTTPQPQRAQTPWWGCLQDKTLELDTSSLDTENILFQLFILSHWTGLNQISTTNSQKSPINSQHILLQKIGVFNEYFTLLMSVKSEMCQKIIRFF